MNERSIFFLLFSDACRLNPLKGIYQIRKEIKKRKENECSLQIAQFAKKKTKNMLTKTTYTHQMPLFGELLEMSVFLARDKS